MCHPTTQNYFKKNDQLVKRLAFGSSVKPFLFNTICLTLGVARVFIITNNKSTMGTKNVTKDTLAKNQCYFRASWIKFSSSSNVGFSISETVQTAAPVQHWIGGPGGIRELLLDVFETNEGAIKTAILLNALIDTLQ